jgi:hypothetical protein
MAWFKKKPDLISDRARTLNDQIARLESEIARLDEELQKAPSPPPQHQLRTRSTAVPGGGQARPGKAAPQEPIFEEVDQGMLAGQAEGDATPGRYNDLGMRKYDLPALLGRIRNHFRGPSTTNPKLVNYLAAGGIQGLRPLRYEKRVARNRFLVLVIGLFLMLLGLIWVIVKSAR